VSQSLYGIIKEQADRREQSVSAYVRSVLKMHFDPDGDTLRLCQDARRQAEQEAGCADG
jgi:hypothetical protein